MKKLKKRKIIYKGKLNGYKCSCKCGNKIRNGIITITKEGEVEFWFPGCYKQRFKK